MFAEDERRIRRQNIMADRVDDEGHPLGVDTDEEADAAIRQELAERNRQLARRGRDPYESTSPTSDKWAASYCFDNVMKQGPSEVELPENYGDAWSKFDVEKLLSKVDHLRKAYDAIVDDVNNGKVHVRDRCGGAWLHTRTVAKYMQPVIALDDTLDELQRKLDSAKECDEWAKARGIERIAPGTLAPVGTCGLLAQSPTYEPSYEPTSPAYDPTGSSVEGPPDAPGAPKKRPRE